MAPPSRPRLALTVSGGVSLGAYQGGATWALVFALRHRDQFVNARNELPAPQRDSLRIPNDYQLDLITGASAGNVNAIFTGLDYCSVASPVRPDSSMFYTGWIPIGFRELTAEPVDTENLAIFSRARFKSLWKDVDAAMKSQPYQSGCDLLLGIAVTKLTPMMLTYSNGIDVPLQHFAGLFRMTAARGQLAFALPRATDLPTAVLTDLLIPALSADGRRVDSLEYVGEHHDVRLPRRAVQEFVEASGAFPIAFAPRLVFFEKPRDIGWTAGAVARPLCEAAAKKDASCLPTDRGLFVDGGIFDNRPLNLALELAHLADTSATRTLLSERQLPRAASADVKLQGDLKRVGGLASDSAQAAHRDSLAATASAGLPHRMLYFVRHEALRGPGADPTPIQRNDGPRAGIAAGLQVLASTFETGQNGEVRLFVNGFNSADDSTHRLVLGVNSRNPRLMGEQISHFGAFLAKTFREYDYYAGVYDGLRSAFRELYCRRVDSVSTSAPALPGTCEQLWLRVAIDQDLVHLKPAGRALIENLFAHERGRQSPLVPDGPDRTAALVLTTLADANVMVREGKAKPCATHALFIENALCDEQLLAVLAEWKHQLDIHGVGNALCKDASAQDLDACDLLEDARAVYHDRALQVLSRMQRAENKLEKAHQPAHTVVVSWPLYLERAFNEQYRSCGGRHYLKCYDLNPTSTDVIAGKFWASVGRALPVNVGGLWSGKSRWTEWRPSVYPRRFWNISTSLSVPIDVIRDTTGWNTSAGFGATIMPSAKFLSSVSFAQSWPVTESKPHAYQDLTAAFFAGVLRVGFRDVVGGHTKLLSRANFTIGVGDANGLSTRAIRRISIFAKQLAGGG